MHLTLCAVRIANARIHPTNCLNIGPSFFVSLVTVLMGYDLLILVNSVRVMCAKSRPIAGTQHITQRAPLSDGHPSTGTQTQTLNCSWKTVIIHSLFLVAPRPNMDRVHLILGASTSHIMTHHSR